MPFVVAGAPAAGSRPTACRGAGSSRRHRQGRDGQRGDPATGALVPVRFPLDALTLTASRSRPSSVAMASRIASRWRSRRGRAATIVRSTDAGRQPAAATGHGPRPAALALAIPRRVRLSAGKRRPRSPRPAAPSNASASAWRATSPSEWPNRRGAPSIRPHPARGAPRPERVAVVTDPDARRAARATEGGRSASQVRGRRQAIRFVVLDYDVFVAGSRPRRPARPRAGRSRAGRGCRQAMWPTRLAWRTPCSV